MCKKITGKEKRGGEKGKGNCEKTGVRKSEREKGV